MQVGQPNAKKHPALGTSYCRKHNSLCDETVPVGKDCNRLLPKRYIASQCLHTKCMKLTFDSTTLHFRVDAEKRNAVLQTAPTYYISAYIDMR